MIEFALLVWLIVVWPAVWVYLAFRDDEPLIPAAQEARDAE